MPVLFRKEVSENNRLVIRKIKKEGEIYNKGNLTEKKIQKCQFVLYALITCNYGIKKSSGKK